MSSRFKWYPVFLLKLLNERAMKKSVENMKKHIELTKEISIRTNDRNWLGPKAAETIHLNKGIKIIQNRIRHYETE